MSAGSYACADAHTIAKLPCKINNDNRKHTQTHTSYTHINCFAVK